MGSSRLPFAVPAVLALSVLLAAQAGGATTRKKKKSGRPAPTPTARPYQGPPAPTPAPFLRAAGACMEFLPGEYLVLAEVGATGRVFRIDGETRVETDVRKGVRVRVLYVEGAGGPVARRVLPGPVAQTPAPRKP